MVSWVLLCPHFACAADEGSLTQLSAVDLPEVQHVLELFLRDRPAPRTRRSARRRIGRTWRSFSRYDTVMPYAVLRSTNVLQPVLQPG